MSLYDDTDPQLGAAFRAMAHKTAHYRVYCEKWEEALRKISEIKVRTSLQAVHIWDHGGGCPGPGYQVYHDTWLFGDE